MESLLGKLPEYVEIIAQAFLAISILASIVVRLTPSKKDDEFVGSAAEKFLKFMSYLPTVGINPRTKKLEEAYKDLKEQMPKDEKPNAS